MRVIGELDDGQSQADLKVRLYDESRQDSALGEAPRPDAGADLQVGPTGDGLHDVPRFTPSGARVSGPVVLQL